MPQKLHIIIYASPAWSWRFDMKGVESVTGIFCKTVDVYYTAGELFCTACELSYTSIELICTAIQVFCTPVEVFCTANCNLGVLQCS